MIFLFFCYEVALNTNWLLTIENSDRNWETWKNVRRKEMFFENFSPTQTIGASSTTIPMRRENLRVNVSSMNWRREQQNLN